jgi:hypothetical protein
MRKVVFIIGPMVGLERLNLDVFRAVADKVEGMGHVAVVPHDLFHEEENGIAGIPVAEARERMRAEMDRSDAVVALGDITHLDPFAWPLLLHARRNIMNVVRVDRITIDLKIEKTKA